MILAGDEYGRSQLGNNNAYCHDSEVSWQKWDLDQEMQDQLEFVRELLQLRRTQPVFRRRHFFQGRAIHGTDIKDLYWLRPDGAEMSDHDWSSPHIRCFGMGLLGDQIDEVNERGEPITGDSFLILFNSTDDIVPFRLSNRHQNVEWTLVLDTFVEPSEFENANYGHMQEYPLNARSMTVLQPRYAPFL